MSRPRRRRLLAWVWDYLVYPLPDDEQRTARARAGADLCAACGVTDEQMRAALSAAVRGGRASIKRELRAQRGGET